MFVFGPISSIFDFVTFGILLGVFHARPELFRTGWFIESLATQTLIIFAIRTRRRAWRSRPSLPLTLISVGAVLLVGVILPFIPVAGVLGFIAPPLTFLATVVLLIGAYLVLVEAVKLVFGEETEHPVGQRPVVVRHVRTSHPPAPHPAARLRVHQQMTPHPGHPGRHDRVSAP